MWYTDWCNYRKEVLTAALSSHGITSVLHLSQFFLVSTWNMLFTFIRHQCHWFEGLCRITWILMTLNIFEYCKEEGFMYISFSFIKSFSLSHGIGKRSGNIFHSNLLPDFKIIIHSLFIVVFLKPHGGFWIVVFISVHNYIPIVFMIKQPDYD